uniref:Uncharacterized protein n=1 Tax=Setaria viridis TaxID=4556 RepID=A0A4U6TNT6_SETVI|nr:hypothetical protein SEVIR_8G231500v2 [Setaria viridis]
MAVVELRRRSMLPALASILRTDIFYPSAFISLCWHTAPNASLQLRPSCWLPLWHCNLQDCWIPFVSIFTYKME